MRNVIVGCFLLGLSLNGDETPSRSNVLSSLVQTERSFARTCQGKGIRASFMEFFADNGIAFVPEPLKYKEAVKNLPPPSDPHAVSLEWEPQTGDVAASGDLGYTSGPSVRTDNVAPEKPKRYGVFFSVWKKQKGGTWKVAADIGVATPTQSTPLGMPFKEPRVRPFAISSTEIAATDKHATILNLESEFSKSCSSVGVLDGYLSRINDDSRLYRTNEMPIVGAEVIRSYLSKETVTPVWTPQGGEVSQAGDLGYAYGSYECRVPARDQTLIERGYYLRVWKRTAGGKWILVADVTNPLPSDGK